MATILRLHGEEPADTSSAGSDAAEVPVECGLLVVSADEFDRLLHGAVRREQGRRRPVPPERARPRRASAGMVRA